LVQNENNKVPVMPSLTPDGFARWMTLYITAFPNQEAIRLDEIVRSLPIDADGHTVDGKPERLPKVVLDCSMITIVC
jgi:hypothetical protein